MTKFTKKQSDSKDSQKIIKDAKNHISNFNAVFQRNIANYNFMTAFINGEMWEQNDIDIYKSRSKARLTFNKIRPILRQIIGEDEEFSVDIKLREVAVDKQQPQQPQQPQPQQPQLQQQPLLQKDSTKDTLIGLVRNIAYHSKTQSIYKDAQVQCLEGGYAAWRVIVIREGNVNALRVRKIINPVNCYWDLNAKDNTKIDGQYAGLISHLSKEEFERLYSNFPYPDSFTDTSDCNISWGDEDRITICEEYKRVYKNNKKYLLTNNQWISEKEFKEALKNNHELEEQIVDTKIENVSKIIHYKFTDKYILEKSETPFDDLPLIFVKGSSRIIKGKQFTYSYAQDVVDAQRLLNFIKSEIADWLKISKKAKFIVPNRMIDKYIEVWNDMNSPSIVLPYDPSSAPGYKPEVLNPPSMPTDLMQQASFTEEDIKVGMGRYEANIGRPSNEKSGIAILNRATAGNSVLGEYRKGRNEAIEATGKIILNAIPFVYDSKRSITITDENSEDKTIEINSPFYDDQQQEYSMQKMFKPNRYSIEVSVGSSFPMQKAANAELALNLIKADASGQAYNLLAQLVAENIDVNKSDKISERLKSLVPPQVLAEETGKPLPPNPEAVLNQQLEQLKLIAAKQQIQDQHMFAMSNHLKAMADMYDSQTGRLKVEVDAHLTDKKIDAEIQRSESEEVRERLELTKEIMKNTK